MYESCSNRNLFGVVTRRTWNFSVLIPIVPVVLCTYSTGGTEAHWPRRGALGFTPRRCRREGCALIQGAATNATKIIAFRCPEGGTTAFDKTFSAISALPRLFPPFPSAHRQRVVLVTVFLLFPLPPICVRAYYLSVCFYCNTSQTGTKMVRCNSDENSECGFLLVPLRIAMHRAQLEPSGWCRLNNARLVALRASAPN